MVRVGLAIVLVAVLAAVFGPALTPYSPAAQELSPVQDALRPIGANLLQVVPQSPATDIEPLADKGVPAFAIWQNGLKYFTYHHTAADTLDKVVPQELRENAACMAVLGYGLANMVGALAK